jgi:hypothetical protein
MRDRRQRICVRDVSYAELETGRSSAGIREPLLRRNDGFVGAKAS